MLAAITCLHSGLLRGFFGAMKKNSTPVLPLLFIPLLPLLFLPHNTSLPLHTQSQWVSPTLSPRLASLVCPSLSCFQFSPPSSVLSGTNWTPQWPTTTLLAAATLLGKNPLFFPRPSLLACCSCFMMKANWSVFMRRIKTPLQDYTTLREIAFLIRSTCHCCFVSSYFDCHSTYTMALANNTSAMLPLRPMS
jgi:hypothetical protein